MGVTLPTITMIEEGLITYGSASIYDFNILYLLNLVQVNVNAGAFALASDFASSRGLSQLCAEFNIADAPIFVQRDSSKRSESVLKADDKENSDTAEGFKTPRTDHASGSLLPRPADLPPPPGHLSCRRLSTSARWKACSRSSPPRSLRT